MVEKITFSLGPNVNFVGGLAIAHPIRARHFHNVLCATFQTDNRVRAHVRHQFDFGPRSIHRPIRYVAINYRHAAIVYWLPAHSYAVR